MRIYQNAKLDKSIPIDWEKSFYLSGGVGTGKTHNVYAFMLETNRKTQEKKEEDEAKLIWTGYNWITFFNFAGLCDTLRNAPLDSFDGTVKTRTEMEMSVIKKGYLILDDLGAEKRSDYSDDFLMRLVEYRYSNDLYTGFTSNLSLGNLPYDSRIISRIAGIVGKNKHEIKGKDRRI